MATKRSSSTAKSESGAYMSKYDQEVEKRLTALEATAHAKCEGAGGGDSERIAALEARVDELIVKLKTLRNIREVL